MVERDAGSGESSEKASGEKASGVKAGGHIPGAPGVPAFTLRGPEPSAIPILIAVPHAGRTYPEPLLAHLRHPGHAALKLEDRYVDRLAEAVAEATGAALLVAEAPRAMIDLNRAPDDIDWDMIAGVPDNDEMPASGFPGRRARSGLGLIPRRVPGLGELWKRRHDRGELAARIEGIHAPYHACLAEVLADIRERWGAALLIDLHSMPPLQARAGQLQPEFVLGDRYGASCAGGIIAGAFSMLSGSGRVTAHNRPYAGDYVLDHHADPAHGLHAFQIEIDRRSYLDSRLAEPGEGFAPVAAILEGLVRRLAAEVAVLGRERGLDAAGGRFSEAAE